MSILAPILSIVGGLISGGQQQSAANSASAGESALASTQSKLINALLDEYTSAFKPLQTSTAGTYGALTGANSAAGGTISPEILNYVITNLLQPYFNPYQEQAVRQQNVLGLKNAVNALLANPNSMPMDQLMAQIKNLGENFLTTDAASNINMAGQNVATSRNSLTTALNTVLNTLGGAGQYSQVGQDLTGQAEYGTQGLIGTYAGAANAAAGAGNPLANAATSIANYLAKQPGGGSTATTDPSSPYFNPAAAAAAGDLVQGGPTGIGGPTGQGSIY